MISHHAHSFPPLHRISVRSVSPLLLADLPPSGDGPLSRGVTDASDLKGLLPSARPSRQRERQGPFIKDVRKILRLTDPLPLVLISRNLSVLFVSKI